MKITENIIHATKTELYDIHNTIVENSRFLPFVFIGIIGTLNYRLIQNWKNILIFKNLFKKFTSSAITFCRIQINNNYYIDLK